MLATSSYKGVFAIERERERVLYFLSTLLGGRALRAMDTSLLFVTFSIFPRAGSRACRLDTSFFFSTSG